MSTLPYVALEHNQESYKKWLVVNWCFFNVCNYDCSYCPTTLHDGSEKGHDFETVRAFCDRIIDADPSRKVFFELTGGEVTFYRDFERLMAYLKERGCDTGIISNGSRKLEWWEKNRHRIDHICLSFHPERGEEDHFVAVAKLVNETCTVHVNIMMKPELFERCHALAQRVVHEVGGVSISMQPLLEDMKGDLFLYTPEQQAILNEQRLDWDQSRAVFPDPAKPRKVYRGEMRKVASDGSHVPTTSPELIARSENSWTGWSCHAGMENIVVDLYGNVFRGWCLEGGRIGVMTDPNFTVPTTPVRCTKATCPCGLDIMCTKRRVPA